MSFQFSPFGFCESVYFLNFLIRYRFFLGMVFYVAIPGYDHHAEHEFG